MVTDGSERFHRGDGQSELASEVALPLVLVGCGAEQVCGGGPVGGAVAGEQFGGFGAEVAVGGEGPEVVEIAGGAVEPGRGFGRGERGWGRYCQSGWWGVAVAG